MYAGGIQKRSQSQVVLDLRLRGTRAGKSRDYDDVIVFEKLRFQNVSIYAKTKSWCFQNVFHEHENEKLVFSNSSGLKSVFKKLRFRDGLVWLVRLTGEIK